MPALFSLTGFVSNADHTTLLIGAVIALCALVFEDVTIFIVGVLAADGLISVPIALISLYAGIALGDTLLYALGAFARTHPRLAHYIDHDFTAPFRSWLEHRYGFKVFSGHFVPGFRFTTFAASGFFRLPLRTYAPMAIAGGLTVLTILFTVSYVFGSFSSTWLREVRWGIAAVFLIALFLIARHNIRSYRKETNAPEEPRAV